MSLWPLFHQPPHPLFKALGVVVGFKLARGLLELVELGLRMVCHPFPLPQKKGPPKRPHSAYADHATEAAGLLDWVTA